MPLMTRSAACGPSYLIIIIVVVALCGLLFTGHCQGTNTDGDGSAWGEPSGVESVRLSIEDLVTPSRHYQPDDPDWHERWLARGYTPYIFFDNEVYKIIAPHSISVPNNHDYAREVDWEAISDCMHKNAAAASRKMADEDQNQQHQSRSRRKHRQARKREETEDERGEADATAVVKRSCPPEFEDGFMRSVSVTTYPSLLMSVERFEELVKSTHVEVHERRTGKRMPLHVHETTAETITISMLSEWAGSAQTSVWHYRRGHALGIVVTFHISMRYSRPGMIETYRPYIRSKIHDWVAECRRVAAWLLEDNDVQLDASEEKHENDDPENSDGEGVVPTAILFGTHVFSSNTTE